MAELEIRTLGQFQVSVDGMPVEEQRWVRKKAKTLIRILALAPRRTMHREQICEILWPETDPESALNNFHKAVHAARRALEPDLKQGAQSRFLLVQDFLVSLAPAPSVTIDLEEFQTVAEDALRTLATSTLEQAAALYHGDLLEEDRYEDWASLPRERIRLLYEQVLERLAANHEEQGHPATAEVTRKLLAFSPANEEAHRRLMRIYLSQGQRHLALNQYATCCEALTAGLGASPEAETVQLYERIAAGTQAAGTRLARPIRLPAPPGQTRRRTWILLPLGAVLLAGLFFAWQRTVNRNLPASIAILPLRTQGVSEVDEVADGLTDGLITSMSRLPGLRVMARGTVFAYKGRTDALGIGRELKVASVLSGKVTHGPETWMVAVELIDVEDGARMWSRTFNVGAKNLSSLEQTITSELTAAIGLRIAAKPARRTPVSAETYRLYLSGRSAWNRRTAEGFHQAIGFYQDALAQDPTYAEAYAGMADSFGLLGFEMGNPGEYFRKARAAAAKAIELDPGLPEAHTSLAMVAALYDWNWTEAELGFRRAIALNFGYSTAHHWYGVHLGAMGRFAEANTELGRALELDPLSPVVALNASYPLYYQRQYPEARKAIARAVELNPSFPPAHEDLMLIAEKEGNQKMAADEALLFLRSSGQTDLAQKLEAAYTKSGYRSLLQEWLAAAEQPPDDHFVSPMTCASLANRMGDSNRSLRWLQKAFDDHSPPLVYIAVDPQYDSLRPDPRFQDLLRRIGLPVR